MRSRDVSRLLWKEVITVLIQIIVFKLKDNSCTRVDSSGHASRANMKKLSCILFQSMMSASQFIKDSDRAIVVVCHPLCLGLAPVEEEGMDT